MPATRRTLAFASSLEKSFALLQVPRTRSETLFDAKLPRNHLLIDGELDDGLQGLSIAVDAERKRISDHSFECDGSFVCRREIFAGVQVRQVSLLARLNCTEAHA